MSRGCITVDTDVTVDIWPDDLEAEGYHHEDDCPAKTGKGCAHPDRERLDEAFDDLHRQAGHGEFPAYACLREPCRSLYLIPFADISQHTFGRRSVA